MKALLTGSTGFIGSALLRLLEADPRFSKVYAVSGHDRYNWVDAGEKVCHWGCDVSDAVAVRELFRFVTPDVIFHLAAIPLVKERGARVSKTNVLGTHNLLAHANPGTRFVLASSAEVYGAQLGPFACHENNPAQPKSVYGVSKLACEGLLKVFDEIKGVSLRLAANVGGGATHGLLPDLVRKFREGNVVQLLGNAPGSVKPFTHVEDTAHAFIQAATEPGWLDYDAVNVVADGSLSVLSVAALASASFGERNLTWSGESWKGDSPKVILSNGRAKLLGWRPKYPTSEDAVRQALSEF